MTQSGGSRVSLSLRWLRWGALRKATVCMGSGLLLAPTRKWGGAGYRMSKMHSQDNLMLVRGFNFKVDLNDVRGALFHAQETVGQGTASFTGWHPMMASLWRSVPGYGCQHQLTEGPDMWQFVAAFALKQEDFLMAEEHAQIAHREFAFAGAGAR